MFSIYSPMERPKRKFFVIILILSMKTFLRVFNSPLRNKPMFWRLGTQTPKLIPTAFAVATICPSGGTCLIWPTASLIVTAPI